MRKQILIVEDNELNREILAEILAENYFVLEAENGQEALDILETEKDHISLILLDVMMPVMDGYSFLDHVRNDPELSLIPVIVMTQNDSEEDEVEALAHGATDFVPKPYRPQVLLHRVASLIRLRETAAIVNQLQYDRLTGLYTKEYFFQKARERLQEDPDSDYCIVCSNIENFKIINDVFGTKVGDQILQETAAIALEMVGSSGICGRFTADRFLCLQKSEVEQRDRNHFGSFPGAKVSPLLKNVTMRWGIYEIHDRSVPIEQMCDRALLAADSIKGQYNQPFAVYDDSLRNKLLREQSLTSIMESALKNGEFKVYLQPKYSLNEDCMAGAEALVRWIHPEMGFLSPAEFIPLFEKNGFIPRLDRYVWEQVCSQLSDWKAQGYPLLPVSVNVSRADVFQGELVQTLCDLTRKYDIEPTYLHLEITESAYAESPDQIIKTAAELRHRGFIVEMDDFGSGYSSLNMLSQMTIDTLKLDMKFIQSELAKPVDQSLLNDVITMAHRFHMSVVAEGVETREQMSRLRALGCDYVQGYYFAKPMPMAEYEKLLRSWRPSANYSLPTVSDKDTFREGVLVVEENPAYRKKVREVFQEQYSVLESTDCESALQLIADHGRNQISVVILSMTLPDDGARRVLDALRQDPALWQLPVIATIPTWERMEEFPLALETDDFLCKCHPLFDLVRRVQRLIAIVSLQQRARNLKDEANRDPLTGLLNRRGLQAAMSTLRLEDTPLAVYIFDLDDLKYVNDSYGHNAGDAMIQHFAEQLHDNTRYGDILCRYGGDEFIAILKHMNQPDKAVQKGESICSAYQNYLIQEQCPASCSAGVVICSEDEKPTAELIERADQALYRAKQQSKGRCCLWTPPHEPSEQTTVLSHP